MLQSNKNNVFCFWESDTGMPAYLKLCIKTWNKNIPNCEVHILNYGNLHLYLNEEEGYDINLLKLIPLPMQSDIISAAILEKFGGLFMDVDCIVTESIFDIFNQISSKKLIGFGRHDKRNMHLAVLYCKKANNPILKKWREEAQVKLKKNIPNPLVWSYFGNSILNPLLAKDNFKNDCYIIDRSISGNILESSIFPKYDKIDPEKNYQEFYFNKFIEISEDATKLVSCGVISLHNSWTPRLYKNIYDSDVFLRTNVALSKFLNFVLYSNRCNTHILKNSLIFTESFIQDLLESLEIVYQKRYFKDILVFDFDVQGFLFAFDIKYNYDKDELSLFIILRNIESTQLLKLNAFSNLLFDRNKSLILKTTDKEEIAHNIVKMRKLVEESISSRLIMMPQLNVNENVMENNLVEDGVFMNIYILKLIDSKLFIKGEAFIINSNVKDYTDIKYSLEFNGSQKYIFPLGKEASEYLTKIYANNDNIFYDKCIVTTYGNKGIEISSLPNGEYELFLHIEYKNTFKRQKLRTKSISDCNIRENNSLTFDVIQISN